MARTAVLPLHVLTILYVCVSCTLETPTVCGRIGRLCSIFLIKTKTVFFNTLSCSVNLKHENLRKTGQRKY
jgi:hypothetical protein